MIAIALCVIAFVGTLWASRRSLGAGLATTMAVGYAYGIVRANLLSAPAHLWFDCAVLGLYLGAAGRVIAGTSDPRVRPVVTWVLILVGWPVLLFFVPGYDPLLQVVGLRGNAFLLPFLLVGALLNEADIRRLAVWLAVLNVAALALAGAEYFTDVRQFFPQSEVTRIIYNSNDVAHRTALRIPSSFVNAHAYAGTMVMTVPVLLAAFVKRTRGAWWNGVVCYGGLGAALIGVFLAAVRLHAAALIALAALITLSGRLGKRAIVPWAVALATVALVVSSSERLQRFATLQDFDMVRARIGGSVNSGVFDAISSHPLGNGLAGGGTSLPYFLQVDPLDVVNVENEYGRIGVEQGTVGLCLWIGFLLWFAARGGRLGGGDQGPGRLAAWAAVCLSCAMGLVGTGLLTAVPHTCLMLLLAGWVSVPSPAAASVPGMASGGAGRFVPGLRPGWRERVPV